MVGWGIYAMVTTPASDPQDIARCMDLYSPAPGENMECR